MTERAQESSGGGMVLRLSVTGRCNLRCRYCRSGLGEEGEGGDGGTMPPLDEVQARVRAVASLFRIVKVRVTGGEPLLRADLGDIARELARLPGVRRVGVTTNGLLLARRAGELAAAGVTGVNVSLDSLDPACYARITGGGELGRVLEGIEAARRAGIGTIKTNCVVMRGVNDAEVPGMVRFAVERGIEARFLELMPLDGDEEVFAARRVGADEIVAAIEARFPCAPIAGRQEQTARMLAVRDGEREGAVGVISSADGKMCLACNRIRITADGKLRRCLKDSSELDLGGMLRAGLPGGEVRGRVRAYMETKERPAPFRGRACMVRIGG